MKKVSVNTGNALRIFGLILSLGSMPLLLGVTGCTTASRLQQSTGEQIDDRNTSSRVMAALAEDTQYKFNRVNVETFKAKVQLNGFVDSSDQKNRAGDLATKVAGVKEVQNNITVKE
jgi:osmotically-inducible protein OsmY